MAWYHDALKDAEQFLVVLVRFIFNWHWGSIIFPTYLMKYCWGSPKHSIYPSAAAAAAAPLWKFQNPMWPHQSNSLGSRPPSSTLPSSESMTEKLHRQILKLARKEKKKETVYPVVSALPHTAQLDVRFDVTCGENFKAGDECDRCMQMYERQQQESRMEPN